MNNKGITLTSLVVYIAVVFVVLAALMRITTYFSKNVKNVADVSFETEFNKINLYLVSESEKQENEILSVTDTQISFSSGNKYTYNQTEKKIYLNDSIKVCENVTECLFEQKIAENGRNILTLTITIKGTTKTAEYIIQGQKDGTGNVDIKDYLWGGSLASYYLKAGDYVNYTPDIGTYKVAAGETGSGYTSMQSFTTETGTNALKWRVLSIDEVTGKIELVSETVGQSLTLQGADGYNHAVDILNDLCEKLYSKTVNGNKVAIGRSINIEDINKKTTYDYTNFTRTDISFKYGDRKQLSAYGTSSMKYPNIYKREIGFGTAGNFNSTGLRESEGLKDGVTDASGVTAYSTVIGSIDGNTAKTDPYITYTYYGHNGSTQTYYPENCLDKSLGINTLQMGLINIGSNYWLSSRYAAANAGVAYFGVRYMNSAGGLSGNSLFYSNENTQSLGYPVRPLVTLQADLLDFSVGNGSKENPWGMK